MSSERCRAGDFVVRLISGGVGADARFEFGDAVFLSAGYFHAGNDQPELLRSAGLRDVIERTPPHRLDGRFNRGVRGHQNYGYPRRETQNFLEQIETALLAQSQVEQHHVECSVPQCIQGGGAIGRERNIVPHCLNRGAQCKPDVLFVINNENPHD